MDNAREALVKDLRAYIDDKRTPELVFKSLLYPSSGVNQMHKQHEQLGQLADFILARERLMIERIEEPIKNVYKQFKHLDGPLSLSPPWKYEVDFTINMASDFWIAIKKSMSIIKEIKDS